MNLSEKTVERLLRCRRELLKYQFVDKPHVFSNDLARILNIRPEQLRQDLMSTGIAAGSNRNGYDVNALIKAIEDKTGLDKMRKIAFIGDVSLVDVYKTFTDSGLIEFNIDAIFNFSIPVQSHHGVPCYTLDKMPEIIPQSKIEIVVVAVCADLVRDVVDTLLLCGIKGIVNLSSEYILPIPGVQVSKKLTTLLSQWKSKFYDKRETELEEIISKNKRKMTEAEETFQNILGKLLLK
jgi:redox-sensing transcriptional repressor